MQGIGEYFLSVTSAAVICTIVKHLIGDKSKTGKIISMIAGLFMAITLVSPVVHFRIDDIEEYFENFYYDAETVSNNGTQMANKALADIIKEQTEAYILDEAARLGAKMVVEVKLSDSNPPQPNQVVIDGSVSPYQKQCMMRYIFQNIGIPQEQQIWN